MKRIGCAVLLVAAACDSGTSSNNHDLSMRLDMPMQLADGGEDGGGGDMATGCGAEGSACSLSGLNGLCRSNVCSVCTDTTDDSACATAYTAGFICVNGNCHAGCHTSNDCPFQICDPAGNICRNCTQDADCTDNSKPYCQTDGSCGANPVPCTTGSACNGGWCCAGLCQIGGMCCPGDGICTGGETCSTDYQCVNAGNCPSPRPANQVYVDSGAAVGMRGVGSKQCPITSLDDALKMVPSPSPGPFLVCSQGTFNASTIWPLNVPQNFELDGTYCSPSPAPSDVRAHTTLNVPKGSTGVEFIQAGPASIHGFDIISGEPNPIPDSDYVVGIYVNGTGTVSPIKIWDVTVNGFNNGLVVGPNGSALVLNGAHFDQNQVGLSMNSSTAVVVVDATASGYGVTRTTFDNNIFDGISIYQGSVTIMGQNYTGAGAGANAQNVRANNNAVGLFCGGQQLTVHADHFSASSNNGTSSTSGFGVNVLSGSNVNVKFRNSTFNSNQNNGVFIGKGNVTTLGTLDFGKSNDHGFNVIESNNNAGVCIGFSNTSALPAAGNKWKSASRAETNCDVATTNIEKSGNCGNRVDIAGAVEGTKTAGTLANVNNCGEQCDAPYTCNP